MGKRRKTIFSDSAALNVRTYNEYLDQLLELSISMFQWDNLPDTVDARYIETVLFQNGRAVYFKDEIIGDLVLACSTRGGFSVYGVPSSVQAYSKYNHYTRDVKIDIPGSRGEGVVIWNNYLHTNSFNRVQLLAWRLAMLDRIIDVNVNGQKTPTLIQGSEKQRLTLLNLYKEYDGNAPFIFGDSSLDLTGIKAITTGAPYVADKLYQLKTQIWNEALTYLGISNVTVTKKERLISDEVQRAQGGVIASRYGRLEARREAVKHINRLFDLNIKVDYRKDYSSEGENATNTEETEVITNE